MDGPETDTRLSVVNPEGVAYSLRPAGFVSRFLAYAVDSVILWFLLGILSAAAAAAGLSAGNWLMLLVFFAANWFYFTLWEIFAGGATPGKRIFGLKVVSDDGSPVSPGASFTRNLLRFADGFMGLYLIGVLSLVFSPGFRRLGDWAGSTLVVMVRDRAGDAGGTIFTGNVRARQPETPLTGDEKAAVLSFLRRCNLFGRERADEIASGIVPAVTKDSEAIANPGEYLVGLGLGALEKDSRR